MKIIGATIYALKIPFVSAFSHSLHERNVSDSIMVRLVSDDGVQGFGEGVPRPYVTGESAEFCIRQVHAVWPALRGNEVLESSPQSLLHDVSQVVERCFPQKETEGVIASNASRCAIELALLDCLLKRQRLPLSDVLTPKRTEVVYSGVISSGSTQAAEKLAKQCKAIGLRQVKVKIDGKGDRERIHAVRSVLGKEASIRVDANGAFRVETALDALNELVELGIECVEQPIPRGDPRDLAKLKSKLSIPIMVDESLVTDDDARRLIEANACDYFNLRVSKCGGITKTLAMARLAQESGIRLQVGAQVGETAILSAAGRYVAAHLDSVDYVEGSFGTMLLTEDIGEEKIEFGGRGVAPVLKGVGLGVRVREDILRKYASQVIELKGNK